LRDERREPQRNVESCLLQFFNGPNPRRRRTGPFVSPGQRVGRAANRNLNMSQLSIHDGEIFVRRHQRGFRNDQVFHALSVEFPDRAVSRAKFAFGRLKTVGHPAEPDNRTRSDPPDGFCNLFHRSDGRSIGISHAPEVQQRTRIAIGAIMRASPAI